MDESIKDKISGAVLTNTRNFLVHFIPCLPGPQLPLSPLHFAQEVPTLTLCLVSCALQVHVPQAMPNAPINILCSTALPCGISVFIVGDLPHVLMDQNGIDKLFLDCSVSLVHVSQWWFLPNTSEWLGNHILAPGMHRAPAWDTAG